jgi:hypothetical protein
MIRKTDPPDSDPDDEGYEPVVMTLAASRSQWISAIGLGAFTLGVLVGMIFQNSLRDIRGGWEEPAAVVATEEPAAVVATEDQPGYEKIPMTDYLWPLPDPLSDRRTFLVMSCDEDDGSYTDFVLHVECRPGGFVYVSNGLPGVLCALTEQEWRHVKALRKTQEWEGLHAGMETENRMLPSADAVRRALRNRKRPAAGG